MHISKQSAGVLLYRRYHDIIQVFLVHPGGPFWKNKDAGAWSIPKGEFMAGEDPLGAAKREFEEETGQKISGEAIALNPIKQKSGKTVFAWAIEGNVDAENIKSNLFEMEWPPRSGKQASFPEVDKAGWFDLPTAAEKLIPAQVDFIRQLEEILD